MTGIDKNYTQLQHKP